MIGRRVTALTALALMLCPPPVEAREAPDPEHVESAVRFGLPALFAGYRATCADVERGLELLDPLPVDTLAGLVGFVMAVADDDDSGPTSAVGGN
ncbi:hypothetical protein V5F89_13130 [Pelagerythrobacter marensis]|uniref:Uncharacterized protein n=1 Tax=Pelagerythrobacter marensis TaxID=543877 RepID=A0ABZ2D7H9_9SPHN